MAAFTATQTGDWDDGGTWGNTSPGVKGTDWPGLTSDSATLAYTVTYKVSEANELGDITVASGGKLIFDDSADRLLAFEQGGVLTVQSGGEIEIGTSGTPFSSSYTCTITWNYTTDSTGFAINTGATCSVYGSPDYFGGTWADSFSYLNAAWSSGQTFTVYGDFTSKWHTGDHIAVFRGGTTELTRLTGYGVYEITTIAANGGNTDITITDTAPAVTFASGSDVIYLGRNVRFWKDGATYAAGTFNTNRPSIYPSQSITSTTSTHFHNIDFWGCKTVNMDYQTYITNCIVRNCYMAYDGIYYVGRKNSTEFKGNISVSTEHYSIYGCNDSFLEDYTAIGCFRAFDGCNNSTLTNVRVIAASAGFIGCDETTATGYVYGIDDRVINTSTGFKFIGEIGYDGRGNQSWVDDVYGLDSDARLGRDSTILDTKLGFQGSIISQRNVAATWWGAVAFHNYNQTSGDHRVYQNQLSSKVVDADGTGDNPSQRSGGSPTVINLFELQTNIDNDWELGDPIHQINHKFYVTGATTFRYYIQSNFTSTLAADEIFVSTHYCGDKIVSDETVAARSGNTDWSQYIELTVSPSVDQMVELRLYLNAYEVGKLIWIDPQVVITV